MKTVYFILVVFLLGCSASGDAQIPHNADSVKALYDSAMSKAAQQQRPLMIFSLEVNGKGIKKRKGRYCYVEARGRKQYFQVNEKDELYVLPHIETDSVALCYTDSKLVITGKPISRSFFDKGGSVYFGTVSNVKKVIDRYDNDDEYRTDLDNHQRGLSAVLSSNRLRKFDADQLVERKLYYCVIQRGNVENISFYFQ